MKTRLVFCANDQVETEHEVTFVNGEFVLTCPCGRFFKLPGTLDKKGISEALKLHAEHNKDQVTQESVDKEAEEKLKLI